MTSKQENLLDWLRDAHAMEQQAEQMLKAQAARLEHYPQLKTRIEQHIEETHGQQRLLEECLKRLDSSPSTLKDIGAKLMAFGQAVAGDGSELFPNASRLAQRRRCADCYRSGKKLNAAPGARL